MESSVLDIFALVRIGEADHRLGTKADSQKLRNARMQDRRAAVS
jgi:hypothetical protein